MSLVLHVDMNAFFASVEQRANPALRGKPIAVVGSAKRTVVTTASYEARKFGVKTGMNRFEAKRACPQLIFVEGDNRKYIDASVRILGILKTFSPVVEVYSIDEAFVDIGGCTSNFASLTDLGIALKGKIRMELGLTCSVGIGPNKLLAKLASDMKKPDGLVIITDEEKGRLLEGLPVQELWGIGPRLTAGLNAMGVNTCGELGRFPASILRERFGIVGERLKLMGQGEHHSPVVPVEEEAEAKSVGHSMTLPRDVSDKAVIGRYLLKLSEKVGARARRHGLKGRKIALTVRYPDFFTFSKQKGFNEATNDTMIIYDTALSILESMRLKTSVRLLGVSISDVVKSGGQMLLFEGPRRRENLLAALDEINGAFGESTLTWATLFSSDHGDDYTSSAGVISPAWRPMGVKRVDVK